MKQELTTKYMGMTELDYYKHWVMNGIKLNQKEYDIFVSLVINDYIEKQI